MANPDTPRGLTPVSHRNGAPYNGAAKLYYAQDGYAVDLFIGDPVVKVAGGSNDVELERPGSGIFPPGTLPDIQIGVAGGPLTGVIVAFSTNVDDLKTTYGKASTHRVVFVADDPDLIFKIQEVSGGTALTVADVGLNASVVAGSGSTITGLSGFELDNTTEATTAGLELKIMGLANEPRNSIGENANWLVSINDHTEAHGTAGI